MVKIKLSTRNFIFTVVHVHQVKTLWLRPSLASRWLLLRCTTGERNNMAARPLQLEYGRAARRLGREHVQPQIRLLDHSPVDP